MGAASVLDDIQYKEGVITYREQYKLLVQILYLFFLSDITVLGFAVQGQSTALAALTFAFPFAMFIAREKVRCRMIPIVYECVRYEVRMGTTFGLLTKFHLLAEEKSLVRLAVLNANSPDEETTKRAYRAIRGNVVLRLARSIFFGTTGLLLVFHSAVFAAFLLKDSMLPVIFHALGWKMTGG